MKENEIFSFENFSDCLKEIWIQVKVKIKDQRKVKIKGSNEGRNVGCYHHTNKAKIKHAREAAKKT